MTDRSESGQPERDWVAWHQRYADPGSALSERLRWVQGHLLTALDQHPPGPIRLVSACAGQGRDTLGVLAGHPRRQEVRARLLETDPINAAIARDAARDAGLPGVEVLELDAGLAASYLGAVPAGIVLFCGVFGNISDADVRGTIAALPQFCSAAATVLWTRGRRAPDLTVAIPEWFADTGFDLVAFESSPQHDASVGVHQYSGPPVPFDEAGRLFTFGTRTR